MPPGIFIRTKEYREKMRQAKLKNPTRYWLGKKMSSEAIEKMKLGRNKRGIGYHIHTEEHKQKQRERLMGNKYGLGNKSTTGLHWKVKDTTKMSHPKSSEHKRKIGLAHKGKPKSEEHKIKLKWTEERRKKYRELRFEQEFSFQNTSIEVKLQNLLKENSIEFETHYPILGQPDIFIKPNICIFADGCYWHGCEKCKKGTKTERDEYVTRNLQSQGYIVIRLWEHEINSSIEDCFKKIKLN